MYRAIGRLLLLTVIAAVFGYIASYITEFLVMAIGLRSLSLHSIDITPIRSTLFIIFLIYTLIIDYFLINKFFVKSLS